MVHVVIVIHGVVDVGCRKAHIIVRVTIILVQQHTLNTQQM